MNTKYIRRFISIIIILVSILACDLPGTVAPQPVSSDPNTFSTIVAGTANAAAAQTALAAPTLDTPTQSPTETPIPTETAIAPTPQLLFSAYNTAIRQQADDSTLFVDRQEKYELTVPAGWNAFRINEPEFYKLWTQTFDTEPAIQRTLTSIQGMDPTVFRLFAFDIRVEHIRQKAMLTSIYVTWEKTGTSYDGLVTSTQKNNSKFYSASKVLSSKMETNSSNVEMKITEFEIKARPEDGQYSFYEKEIIFKAQTGFMVIKVDTPYDVKDDILSEFDQLKESIKLIEP